MMRREEKIALVNGLRKNLEESPNFYLVDIEGLKGQENNLLRRRLFEKKLRITVVKNTLLKKALEAWSSEQNDSGSTQSIDIEAISGVLKGNTALIFAYDQVTAPAKVIKAFREEGQELPKLKLAYIDGEVFVGDEKLDEIAKLKSKEELLGDLVGLLQAPLQNLLSCLNSGANQISSVLKALENRKEE